MRQLTETEARVLERTFQRSLRTKPAKEMQRNYTEREQFFIERIGKRVYRNAACPCEVCQNIHKNGIIISDELHAIYLSDMEAEFTIAGHPLKYFDTKEEALEFEQNNKPLQD